MNYKKTMLDKLDWNFSNGLTTVNMLDKKLRSYKIHISNKNTPSDIKMKYKEFWSDVAEHNIYICAILVKHYEIAYGQKDVCVECGIAVLVDRLKEFHEDETTDILWHFLAAIELSINHHINEYLKLLINNGKLKKHLTYFQYSNNLSDNVLFLLRTAFVNDMQLRRETLKNLVHLKWNIYLSESENKSMASDLIELCCSWGDIPSLINLLNLFCDLKFSTYSEKTLDEWKQFLLMQHQPISMILFRDILKREQYSPETIINELYSFTSWATENKSYLLNNYLYFSYAIRWFPEEYDKYDKLFEHDDYISVDLTDETYIANLNEQLTESSSRGLNNLIIEKPFLALVKNNPDKVTQFIERTKSFNLFHISRSLTYKKSQTWVENNNSKDYVNFITSYSKTHDPNDVLLLYLSSPLKSIVDFSYVIRLLFQPEVGFTDLTKQMENFVFRGKLKIKNQEDIKTAFRISISNACSSYTFPLHHSWVTLHIDDLQKKYSDGDIVYFKIMSVNSRGMIFAYDLSAGEPIHRKKKEQGTVKSLAIKNINKIAEGSLLLQGNNKPEDITLFVVAMIYDNEDQILVESSTDQNVNIESLPCLPVSNHESTDRTLKRLLKYYLGFRKDIYFQPCGIMHISATKTRRGIFLIYKVSITKCLELQEKLALKNTMHWRDIKTYTENIDDPITERLMCFLNTSWSEQMLDISMCD